MPDVTDYQGLRGAWDRALRGRGRRPWTAVVGWPLVAGLVLVGLLRLFGLEGEVRVLVALVSFTPYVVVAGVMLAAAAALARRPVAATVAGVTALALALAVLPRAMAATPSSGTGTPLVVMSVNMRLGNADSQSIVDLVRSAHVDVLAVQEFTPQAERNLVLAGIANLLPYRESHAEYGAVGSALFSRLPLTLGGVRTVSSNGFRQAYASISPVGANTVVVESVHPEPPLDVHAWAGGLRSQVPASAGGPPRILAGDFNATLDQAALRDLIATGYRDAADEAGMGLVPTWPYYGHRSAVTPKIALDHILAPPGVGVRDFRAVTIPRTDHRAVLATLLL